MNLQQTIRKVLLEETNQIEWVKPEFEKEEDEFGGHFLRWLEDDVIPANFNEFTDKQFNKLWNKIRKSYEKAKVELLSDDEWKKMENTDSWNIKTEDELFDVIHGQWGRSKQRIKKYSINTIKNGGVVETPIVAYAKGHPPYLVAGNTRLSACRMLGVTPMVTKIKI